MPHMDDYCLSGGFETTMRSLPINPRNRANRYRRYAKGSRGSGSAGQYPSYILFRCSFPITVCAFPLMGSGTRMPIEALQGELLRKLSSRPWPLPKHVCLSDSSFECL